MTSKADLVATLKQLQRSDAAAKESWGAFCDAELGGVRDPNRHDAGTLQRFLDMNGGGGAGSVQHQGKSKADLVEALKNLQRTDSAVKEKWGAFCDAQLKGVRDPNKHDVDVLQRFLSTHSGGAYGMAPNRTLASTLQAPKTTSTPTTGGSGVFVDAIKAGQRASSSWRNSWCAYVDTNGKKHYDPSKHDETFLMGFFDQCGQAYEQQMGVICPVGTLDEPSAKRARIAANSGTGDAHKDDLVQRVKKLQRGSEETKAAWQQHADQEQGGIRDPAKHPAESLEQFLMMHESSLA